MDTKTEKALAGLDEYALKVLTTFDPDYEYLVLVVPGNCDMNEFAAGKALADLKKAGFVKFEGRGVMKSVYLNDEGTVARALHLIGKEAANA